jgi:hypothetical protein
MKQFQLIVIFILWTRFCIGCPIVNFTLNPVNVSQMDPRIWRLYSCRELPDLIKCLPIQFMLKCYYFEYEFFTVDWDQIQSMMDPNKALINLTTEDCVNPYGQIYLPYISDCAFMLYGCRVLDDGTIKESYLFSEIDSINAPTDPDIESLMKFPKLFQVQRDRDEYLQDLCEYFKLFVKLHRGKREVYIGSLSHFSVLFIALNFGFLYLFYRTHRYFTDVDSIRKRPKKSTGKEAAKCPGRKHQEKKVTKIGKIESFGHF